MKAHTFKIIGTAFLLLAAFSCSAMAQVAPPAGKPLFDWSRFSVAGGLNYAWYAAPLDASAPVPSFNKEWEAGLYGAYNLTPHLSLAGSEVFGFDNKNVQSRVGFRVRFGNGEAK